MSERWLVAVGAGRWQLSGIKAAQAEGLRVLAVDGNKDAPGIGVADRAVVADIRAADATVQAVRESGIRPAGAIAFVNDAGMMAAAALREAFDLPGARSESAHRLTNKCAQREAWTKADLPCPSWHCVQNEKQARQAMAALEDTVIFKPADSAGSRGVSVVDPGQDWRPSLKMALAGSISGTAILERFVSGTEFTVESFSNRGKTAALAVSEKRKVPGSRETVAIELATSALPRAEIEQIGQLASDALAALGHSDGPGHTEILRDASGTLWLVEAAGRAGGFMVADGIVPRASGYDISCASALQAAGLEPPALPEIPPKAFVLRFIPARRGVVMSMDGFEQAMGEDGVECGPLVSVGDRLSGQLNDAARLAYILTWADDRATAFALADRAEDCIRIEIAETTS